ncbi:MAG: hypothetical protein JWM91_3460 [Rhodospirillales bacterium]|nr:hypothetical protein [Rhodospirillales bacterium]
MTDRTSYATGAQPVAQPCTARTRHDWRLEGLIAHLPKSIRAVVRWLRLPSSKFVRIPAGILLIAGGVFSILPFLGIWMLPLGIVLLAEDVPWLRRVTDKGLDWIERRRPHWFSHPAC